MAGPFKFKDTHSLYTSTCTCVTIPYRTRPQTTEDGIWVSEKQPSIYLSKCIFWNVPGIRTRFSNCSGNCFLNSSATWKESKNKLSPPSTSGSNLHTHKKERIGKLVLDRYQRFKQFIKIDRDKILVHHRISFVCFIDE